MLGHSRDVHNVNIVRLRTRAPLHEPLHCIRKTLIANHFQPRPQCNNCYKLLLYPHQRLNFFSDYSHVVSCVHCTTQDTHFVKPLAYCYTKQPLQAYQQWP